MNDLRLGVIGSGMRGHLPGYAHKPEQGSRVVACCDTSEDALLQCKQRYGNTIFTTKDYHELLAQDLDAVFILTPDFLHEEHAIAALQSGKAVYLEKPMAITVEGCDAILETARITGTKLYCGHNMRHMPFVLKMKELIDTGAIGEVKAVWCRHFVGHGGDFYFKDWHAERRYTLSLLLQKACHDIDIIHWFSGGYTTLVNAMGGNTLYHTIHDRHSPEEKGNPALSLSNWPPLKQKRLNPVIDVEDLSMIHMKMENGVYASYMQCHYTPDYWRNYTVIGTEGRIENSGDGINETVIRLWNKRTKGYNPEGDHIYTIQQEQGGHGGSDVRIVREFIDYVRSAGTISTSPLAARNSVAAGVAATESLRNGGTPVYIKKPSDVI